MKEKLEDNNVGEGNQAESAQAQENVEKATEVLQSLEMPKAALDALAESYKKQAEKNSELNWDAENLLHAQKMLKEVEDIVAGIRRTDADWASKSIGKAEKE